MCGLSSWEISYWGEDNGSGSLDAPEGTLLNYRLALDTYVGHR